MKPTPEHLVRSVRQTLTDVIIPTIGDDWARYEAKAAEKLLLHLELRLRHEHRLLIEDSRQLRDLFRSVIDVVDAEGLESAAGEMRTRLDSPALADGNVPTVDELRDENTRHRAALVALIEEMERATRDDAELAARLEPSRNQVRSAIRDELDRDLLLAEPTFMLFGPPTPARGDGR
jgi:hypothetical protein